MRFVYPIMVIIGFISEFVTIILALRCKMKRIFKYLSSIIIGILAIVFCIIITIIHYNEYGNIGYIGIVYAVVLIIISPGLLLSLLTAACFDIINLLRKNRKYTL